MYFKVLSRIYFDQFSGEHSIFQVFDKSVTKNHYKLVLLQFYHFSCVMLLSACLNFMIVCITGLMQKFLESTKHLVFNIMV